MAHTAGLMDSALAKQMVHDCMQDGTFTMPEQFHAFLMDWNSQHDPYFFNLLTNYQLGTSKCIYFVHTYTKSATVQPPGECIIDKTTSSIVRSILANISHSLDNNNNQTTYTRSNLPPF